MAITTTARALINGAFDLLGVKAVGETLAADDLTDGLRRLNAMIDGWGLQPGTMTYEIREVFDLVAHQASYTMGPSGNFNTVRPVYLTNAAVLLNAPDEPVEMPLEVLSDAAWQAIAVKTQTSMEPTAVYLQPTYPQATVWVWPIPTDATNDLVLYSRKAVTSFATLDTSVALPTGYAEPIEYNLAKRLATPYGQPWPPELDAIARSSLAWVKTSNTKLADLALDPALTLDASPPWNILVGP